MTPKKEIALIRFAQDANGRPFRWGAWCCNTVGLRALDVLTGGNHFAEAAGKFATKAEADEFQRRYGRRFDEYLLALGATEIAPGFEQVGDFLVVEGRKWQMVHVCLGDRILSASEREGVRLFRRSEFALENYRVFRIVEAG